MNKQTKNKRLKPDGAYGRYLNGYTDLAAAQKAQFLKDGKALLKEVGKWLAERGLTEIDRRSPSASTPISENPVTVTLATSGKGLNSRSVSVSPVIVDPPTKNHSSGPCATH